MHHGVVFRSTTQLHWCASDRLETNYNVILSKLIKYCLWMKLSWSITIKPSNLHENGKIESKQKTNLRSSESECRNAYVLPRRNVSWNIPITSSRNYAAHIIHHERETRHVLRLKISWAVPAYQREFDCIFKQCLPTRTISIPRTWWRTRS